MSDLDTIVIGGGGLACRSPMVARAGTHGLLDEGDDASRGGDFGLVWAQGKVQASRLYGLCR
jgi:hypothetical protein